MKVILLAVSLPLAFAVAWGFALRFIHWRSAKARLENPPPVRRTIPLPQPADADHTTVG